MCFKVLDYFCLWSKCSGTIRAGGIGQMDELIRTISARDAAGAERKLYEYRRSVPGHTSAGVRYMRKIRHLELEGGEVASYIDENTFQLVSTREKLSRIKAG
jgi:hypothetical protein